MKKWEIPSVLEFDDQVLFFETLIDRNADLPGFSQRNLSAKLGWPVSYLPDLLKRRKPLTVPRALQFAGYFKLDPLSQEKMILLAISSQIPEFHEKLVGLARPRHSRRNKPTSDWQLLNAQILVVFEAVRWFRGKATDNNLTELLNRYHWSKAEIERCVGLLLEKKLVAKKNAKYVILRSAQHTDDFGFVSDEEFHKDCAKLFIKYMDRKIGPGLFNSAFVHLHVSKFNEFADKIIALRNWIFEHSSVTASASEAKDSVLFQLDLNLVPLFKKRDS